MDHDELLVIVPRPARVPMADIVEAVPASRAEPRKRSEVIAAGALFVALLGMLTVAFGVVTVAIF